MSEVRVVRYLDKHYGCDYFPHKKKEIQRLKAMILRMKVFHVIADNGG